ncbi:pseudouridine synthase [Sulfolobus sp. E5-1-F]|uniref:PUA domain-containing protein n=1 Tax=Sulfolobaceae TaxID=118883 RepID=UPI0012963361|nr:MULTISPECIES: PUA domain-containing protein [unclassified Sulfolobus]QGA55528.1 pseudouridine synthase [Sulfolobus sp. E5-1-F]QGA69614.1 pseudouridine synthase [Sulfolobus sp. E11-6]
MAEYQFDYNISRCLFPEDARFLIQRSLNTKKIRNVLTSEGELYLVLRAQDVLFSLTLLSGGVIKNCSKFPEYRVVIPKNLEEFIKNGRNVFSKHVIAVDKRIRAGDEVIVVNENDELIAIGKAKLSGEEMMEYKRGMAVHVKRGVLDE